MKTSIFLFCMMLWFTQITRACPVCEKQQPKMLRGITHGAGPTSIWDWVIIGVVALITMLTLFYSAKYLLFPGEKSSTHIKNSILQNL